MRLSHMSEEAAAINSQKQKKPVWSKNTGRKHCKKTRVVVIRCGVPSLSSRRRGGGKPVNGFVGQTATGPARGMHAFLSYNRAREENRLSLAASRRISALLLYSIAIATATAVAGQCLFGIHLAYDGRGSVTSVDSRVVRARDGRCRPRVQFSRVQRGRTAGGCRGHHHQSGGRSWAHEEYGIEPVYADTTADRAGIRANRPGQPQDDGNVGVDDQQHGSERGDFHDHPEHGVWAPAKGQVR